MGREAGGDSQFFVNKENVAFLRDHRKVEAIRRNHFKHILQAIVRIHRLGDDRP